MTDTVRDAVFGNVGTMICFRVSADDAPILSKQFEPNFEALDLLQMHNRNFIINMVIGGEKSPAFSARTLELPPAQTDNTSLIIEHTRRHYARERSDIEKEISSVIAPEPPKPQPQKPTPPVVAPAINIAPLVGAVIQPPSTTPIQQQSPEESTPPKKKRTRTRRKKITTDVTEAVSPKKIDTKPIPQIVTPQPRIDLKKQPTESPVKIADEPETSIQHETKDNTEFKIER